MSQSNQFRLVTRSDFDGLVCAMLLTELGLIREVEFVHPKDVQDGKVAIGEMDITTNLPYAPKCHLCFDHHESEFLRLAPRGILPNNCIIDEESPSTARLVYKHYGPALFRGIDPAILDAVDKADAAQLTQEDILRPQGWMLLNFIMDSRTGLGRFNQFRCSNRDLMVQLIDAVRSLSCEEILQLPDVQERVKIYTDHHHNAVEQIRRCSTAHGNVLVINLRNEEVIWAVNRFVAYALYPDCNVSIHIIRGKNGSNTVFALGKSIVRRTCSTNIGKLCLSWQGGGHRNAGTCQVPNDRANHVLSKLLKQLKADEMTRLQNLIPKAG